MGPQQGQRGRDAHVDAIDLTLSSPEPEASSRPQMNTYQQQEQPTTKFKQEPGTSYRNMHSGNESSRRQGSSRNGNVPQQPRQINPQHVQQIIDTSTPRDLRKVVLHLCSISPALSGAVARGLAPKSQYAQQLIRQQARSQAQATHTVKSEHRPNSSDAYDRLKQRFGPSSSTLSSVSRSHSTRPPAIAENRDNLRLPSSQTTPRVKREYRASPTNSDDSTNIVDFSAIERDATRQQPVERTFAGSSSGRPSGAHLHGDRLAVRERATQSHTSDVKPRLCLQCGEIFTEGNTACAFHPGPELSVEGDDIPQYSCCARFSGEPGCTFGRHVSETVGTMTNSKRPSPSPNSGAQWLKKPRVL